MNFFRLACCWRAEKPRRGRPRGSGRKPQRLAAASEADDADTAEILAGMAGMPATGFAAPARAVTASVSPDPDLSPSSDDLHGGGRHKGAGGAGRAGPTGSTSAKPDPDHLPTVTWTVPGAPEMVFWLGLVSAVGTLVHSMLRMPKRRRSSAAANGGGARAVNGVPSDAHRRSVVNGQAARTARSNLAAVRA